MNATMAGEIKPFPTCETCDYRNDIDKCRVVMLDDHVHISELNPDTVISNINTPYWKSQIDDLIKKAPKDFSCLRHSDFNPDNGDNNGKDM
jgi:hypothetical protein